MSRSEQLESERVGPVDATMTQTLSRIMNVDGDEFDDKYVTMKAKIRYGAISSAILIVQKVTDEGEYYVFSESKAGKVKRIRNNGKMAIAPCDMRGKLKQDIWESGTAAIVTDAAKIEDIYRLFDAKYRWQMRLLNFIAKLNGRFNNRAILALKVEPEAQN